MGVPSYFKNIIQNYNDLLIIYEEFNININNLFFDLNCLIHPCCRNLTNEDEMFDTIYDYIIKIINICNPKDLVYIAIDGVCPRAKVEQQKSRRFKSASENKIWDTNAITPGTNFMKKLNKFLKDKLLKCKNHYKTIFSDSDEAGEGEHKIMYYLKDNYKKDNINIVYGLDADLIHLSLIKDNNIFLLRERTEFNFEGVESEFIFLDINKFKKYLVQDIKKDYKINNQSCINDYVFLCFLIGNDFIHNMICINIRYGGLEYLLNAYDQSQKDFSGYFYLIDDNKLDLKNFKYFLNKLGTLEKDKIGNILHIRKNQNRKYLKIYGNIYNDYKNNNLKSYDEDYINEFKNHLPVIDIKDEIKVFKDLNNYKKKYYFFNKYLHHGYDPTYGDILKEEINDICKNYFESIVWTTNYYFNDCLSWKWYYKYHYSPLLSDLNEYLKDINNLDIIKKDLKPLSNVEQLLLVLPEKSLYLNNNFKKEDYYYPKSFYNNTFMKRYYWEGYPVLPE
jgi:5'-3' exoribonuclease 2